MSSKDSKAEAPHDGKKSPKMSVAEDLICPITLELPYDPVIANDGRIYERDAIAHYMDVHYKTTVFGHVKSPVTKEPMGEYIQDALLLVPSIQTKALIETFVETKEISGELAENWKKLVEQKKEIERITKSAEAGNVEDMFLLGILYKKGEDGVTKNDKTAFKWFSRGADERHVGCMLCAGVALVDGVGARQNISDGLSLLTSAAERGSDCAAGVIHTCYRNGLTYNLPNNEKRRNYWYEKSLGPFGLYAKEEDTSDKKILKYEGMFIESEGEDSPFV